MFILIAQTRSLASRKELKHQVGTLNPITQLIESTHEYYQVPFVQQKNINALRLHGHKRAVHHVPLPNGHSIDFFSSLGRSDELFVVFHGANSDRSNFYPRFERVKSMQKRVTSLLSFADPTMKFAAENEMFLAWYLGGATFDPLLPILKVIRKACGRTGANHVVFVGGSGGGFAALRASSMLPGSLAFVQDPQTIVANYNKDVVSKYFSTMWPGWNSESLISAFPERFDMSKHYQNFKPLNFVYYAQSSLDPRHSKWHYLPFLRAQGFTKNSGINASRDRYFALYEGTSSGHGKITTDEFEMHLDEALLFWRNNR